MSVHCKLVSVQYREYRYGLFPLKLSAPNPKFFFIIFSKRIHNLVKTEKRINYVWSCDVLVHGRATGVLGLMHLWRQRGNFLSFWGDRVFSWVSSEISAFKSSEVWCQPQKSLKPPRNDIRQYRLGLFDWVRGLWLSVLSRRIASKTSKWRQVKARNRKSVRMCLD